MSEYSEQNLAFDSERQYLGTVYAKSLLAAAKSAEGAEAVVEAFGRVIHDVLDKHPRLESVLRSSQVSAQEKDSLIKKVLVGLPKTMLHFLSVVCQHGRFDCLRVIYRTALEMLDTEAGRVEVTLTTAADVDEGLRARIAARLTQVMSREVRVQSVVDPEILGGLVVRVGDTVYDGSLANQLERVRRSAIEHAVHEVRQSLDRFVVET